MTFPDFHQIAQAFGIPATRCSTHNELSRSIGEALAGKGPHLLEIMLDPEQPFSPKLASRQLADGTMVSSPLEDLAPFLSREELAENMLIPLVEE